MIVADTNVLVRIITKDDIKQLKAAVALLSDTDEVWISRVVLLEVGWVLDSAFGYSAEEVSIALHKLVSLENAVVEDEGLVRSALSFHRMGMDLGDAFVLASAPEGSHVATFDRGFVRKASRQEGAVPVELIE